VRPGLLTTRGPLILASSVYGKSGELYRAFKKHYGPNGAPAVLVAYGCSRDFHESLPQEEIDQALTADPARNAAEYLSQWRTDIETFVSRELVEACTADYTELAPKPSVHYYAFVDVAGGSGSDSFALAISYRDGQQIVVAAIREYRPPFMATQVVQELAVLLRMYGISRVSGDKYAGGVFPDLFQRAGITYQQIELTKYLLGYSTDPQQRPADDDARRASDPSDRESRAHGRVRRRAREDRPPDRNERRSGECGAGRGVVGRVLEWL
jgi:hypothetical protein